MRMQYIIRGMAKPSKLFICNALVDWHRTGKYVKVSNAFVDL